MIPVRLAIHCHLYLEHWKYAVEPELSNRHRHRYASLDSLLAESVDLPTESVTHVASDAEAMTDWNNTHDASTET